ncbi:hypothetical protein BKA70DRAFT_1218862 [Coprinopsis sp. MPI-PUGE-AT-0042]|nr:hypothetical protein BKA70DRAFT_1218862 [Coprinopsis sp. MPI-PUGE-AT-0042]
MAHKAVHHIISKQPCMMQDFAPLLDRVLHQIDGKDVQDAVHALAGYALASLSTPSSTTASGVTQFIRTHKDTLLPLIEGSLKPSGASQEPLYWSFPLLSSLAILSPTCIFATSTLLKFIFDALPFSGQHTVKSVTALHDEVWKVLAWTLLRLFQEENAPKGRSLTDKVDTFHKAFKVLSQGRKNRVGTCVVAVALSVQLPPEAPSPIKTSFRASTIARSLEVVSTLLQSQGAKSVMEGIRLLGSVTGSRTTGRSMDKALLGPFDFFSQQLLDGSLLDIGLPPMPASTQTIRTRNEAILDQIPHLSEDEIVDHWDALTELWDIACHKSVTLSEVHEYCQDTSHYREEATASLCSTLQALLLPQTQLTQETYSKLVSKTTVVATLAKSTARLSTETPTADPSTTDAQLWRLAFIKRIWRVFGNVFTPSDPPVPSGVASHTTLNAKGNTADALLLASEIILASLLSGPFGLDMAEVKNAWSDLCSDLVGVGVSHTLLHVLWNRRTEAVASEEVVKGLWDVVGRRYAVGTGGQENWVDLVAFLTIPFLSPRLPGTGGSEDAGPVQGSGRPTRYFQWKLTVAEQQTWTTLLRHTLHIAQRVAVKEETVVAHLLEGMQLLSPSVREELQTLYQAQHCLAELLGRLGDAALTNNRNGDIRHLANSIITRLYCEEGRGLALDSPGTILQALDRRGIYFRRAIDTPWKRNACQWIEDADNLCDQETHMKLIFSVYRPAMILLSLLTPSVEVLESFERLMIAPFIKEHKASPLGPQTFIAFWRGQLPTVAFSQPSVSGSATSGWWANPIVRQAFKDNFPSKFEKLGTFLRACADIFPGEEDLVDGLGLSLGSEVSFASPMTVISDSQPTPFRRGSLPVRKAITDPDLARYPELEELTLAESPTMGSKRRNTMDSSSRTPRSYGPHLSAAISTHEPAMGSHACGSNVRGPFVTPTRPRPYPRLHPEGRSWSENNGVPQHTRGGIDTESSEPREGPHVSNTRDWLDERPLKRRRHPVDDLSLPSAPNSKVPLPHPIQCHSGNGDNVVDMERTHTELACNLAFPPADVLEGPKTANLPDEDLECDYESWEAGHSIEGLREIREEMHLGALQSFSLDILDESDSPERGDGGGIPVKDTQVDEPDSRSGRYESPTVSDRLFVAKSKLRDRSMTEPAFEYNPASPSNPFTHPSPRRLRRAKTSSEAQLTALESVYSLVSNTAAMDGISQIPVAELLKAKMIAHRIGEVLDEQVVSKLERGQRPREDKEAAQ